MATLITRVDSHQGLTGETEKRYAADPATGWQWVLVSDDGRGRLFRSRDGGSTWNYASGSDLDFGVAAYASFTIADGYAYVSWCRYNSDPQTIRLARGTPTSGGGWSWKTITVSPAEGRMGVGTDLAVFRTGTGWTAFVSWAVQNNSVGMRTSRVKIAANGTMTVAATAAGPTATGGKNPIGGLEFAHTGDGFTPQSAPHVFLLAGSQDSTAYPLQAYRARYESGTWTWEAPVVLDAGVNLDTDALVGVWDGAALCVGWAGVTGNAHFATWPGTGAATQLDPPALPAGFGNVGGLNLVHDPATDDIYLLAYGTGDGDVWWTKLTRTSSTWSAWTVLAARNASTKHGELHTIRHSVGGSVDVVWGNPKGGDDFDIYYQRLTALTRTPGTPTLLFPASGSRVDLAAGASFTWRYNKVGAADTQQAYVFRRITGATTEYWNAASQAWSTTEVWNPGSDGLATFGPGKWVTGTTYSWSVKTRSSTGGDSAYAPNRTVIATVAPVVTVTAPYGLYYGESTPLVQWTYSSTEAQRDYEVRIVALTGAIDPTNPGPAVWTSGVVASSISRAHRVETPLADGVAYRAYVRATNASGVQSTWASSDFTLSVNPPSGPVVQVYDEVSYDTEVPRVRMVIMARSNFLDRDQAVGTSGWSADTNATVAAVDRNDTNLIDAGLSVTSTAAGLVAAISDLGDPPVAPYGQPQPLGPLTFPVVPGQSYTVIAEFKSAAATRAARVAIRWYDADDGTGDLVGEDVGDQVVASTTAYTQAFVTVRAPQAAAMGRVVLEVLGAVAPGEVTYITRISAHPGADRAWQSGGYTETQVLRVQRYDPVRAVWTPLIARIKPDLRQRAVAYDRLMPLNQDVQYQAWTDVDTGGGAVLSSAGSPVATAFVESALWTIRDPSDMRGEISAMVTDYSYSDEEAATVSRLAGRKYPIVDTEGPQSSEGTMTLYVPGPQAVATADLLTRPVALTVQTPAGIVRTLRLTKRDWTPEAVRSRSVDCTFVEVE